MDQIGWTAHTTYVCQCNAGYHNWAYHHGETETGALNGTVMNSEVSLSLRLLRHQRVLPAEQSHLQPPVLQVSAQCWYLLQHGGLLQLSLLHSHRQPTHCRLRHCLQSELLALGRLPQLYGSTLAHQVPPSLTLHCRLSPLLSTIYLESQRASGSDLIS